MEFNLQRFAAAPCQQKSPVAACHPPDAQEPTSQALTMVSGGMSSWPESLLRGFILTAYQSKSSNHITSFSLSIAVSRSSAVMLSSYIDSEDMDIGCMYEYQKKQMFSVQHYGFSVASAIARAC